VFFSVTVVPVTVIGVFMSAPIPVGRIKCGQSRAINQGETQNR
jgi:hypothetical protein